MVDQEVVDILAEIKQRVTAAHSEKATSPSAREISASEIPTQLSDNEHHFASLSVMARAWDRLPPVVSNRTGSAANLELWIKSKLKRALKWITWEQVNFNAATHQTLLEMVDALNAYETYTHTLLATQNQLRSEVAAQQDQLDDVTNQFANVRDELKKQLRAQEMEFNVLRADVRQRLEALQTSLDEIKNSNAAEAQARIAELVNEFRERDERLLDEQRVCFKQLSLQLTESQVLEDRARHDLDARLNKLENKNQ